MAKKKKKLNKNIICLLLIENISLYGMIIV